jgi:hypothetical protein
MAVAPAVTPRSLRVTEFSDRELLHILDDLTKEGKADSDGWVPVELISERCALRHPNPVRCVVSRFGYMQRSHIAVIERKPKELAYRLTGFGFSVVSGAKLTVTQRKALENLPDAKLLAVTGVLTQRYRAGGEQVGTLIRREFTYGTMRRLNGNGNGAKP